MVHQATAASKKKEVTPPPAFASITAADIIRAPVVEHSVPLDLQPLLKPFKRAGRLFLRIERMPQRAKLSAGRRNTDGSWSLASDELSDLNYLVPSNVPAEHELTIRVMTFEDGAASTLKVIQHPICLEETPDPSVQDDAICRSTETHDPVLRSQLGEMQSLFAVRESEVAELRAALALAKSETTAELGKVLEAERQRWQAEADLRFQKEREAWLAQADQHHDHEHKRRETKSQTTLKQAEERWRMQEAVRAAAAHAEWQRESAHVLAEEKSKAAKLEASLAAETEKRRKLEAALAHTMAQAGAAPGKNAPDLDRLHNELATAKAALAEREEELVHNRTERDKERETWTAQASERLEAEQKRWQAETQQRLESERQAWQAQADQRIAADRGNFTSQASQQIEAERKHWQAESEKRIEGERQAWQAEAGRRAAAEQERWQTEARQHLEAERQRWQAEADQRIEKERQSWQAQAEQQLKNDAKGREAESQAALNQAQAQWKAEEAARSDTARAEWQQLSAQLLAGEKDKSAKLEVSLAVEADKCRKLEAALAQALARVKTAPGEKTPELDLLREELTAAKTALAERELELTRQKAEREQERSRLQQEAQAALETKALAWKNEDAGQLKAMAAARAEADEALAEMTLRCEQAENALARAKRQAAPADDGYVESLRSEITELRRTLAKSETELGWARSALDQSQPLHLRRAAENLPIGMPASRIEEEAPAPSAKKTLIRDFLLVMAVALPAILFYPWFAGYLPDGARTTIASVTGGVLSAGTEHPAVTHAVQPAPAPVVQRPSITVSRAIKLHATPATKGTVVLSLPKGGTLTVLEQSGAWTKVEVPAKDGKPQQGWVYSSSLASKKDAPKEPAAPAPVRATNAAPPPAPVAAEHASAEPPASSPAETSQPASPPAQNAQPESSQQ
ncbi:MAG TPA: SH3 domain-containing protein [Rhizomicrobium sp.]|nr:SH3 domain-containing protein [Rhizomicrobium sp.]